MQVDIIVGLSDVINTCCGAILPRARLATLVLPFEVLPTLSQPTD